MQAVGYYTAGSIDHDDALIDIELAEPSPGPHDLLVRVHAVSVNPVDTKVRQSRQSSDGSATVLGYDACGVVAAMGAEVTDFATGDAVYYAGSVVRPGTNSELHVVDARIVGRKPSTLSDAEAAALPLTALTAWEMLFDRLDIRRPTPEGGKVIVVIGGAGGVGSITIQLLRALTDFTIIATASRPETRDYALQCGAHHVINHREPMAPQIAALDCPAPGFVFSTTHSEQHLADIVQFIAPQGRFGLIDDADVFNIMPFKPKSVSIHWVFMFTRAVFSTADISEQSRILNEVAQLIDDGRIHTTLTEVAGTINANNLRQVHRLIESNRARGKIVLEGFAQAE